MNSVSTPAGVDTEFIVLGSLSCQQVGDS
ncbi:MAG: hypothetical protein RLZZ169_1873, partial [Pseudomonadota bacterium]